MAKRKPAKHRQSVQRIDDALRRAVKESGLTVYAICRDAHITTDSLYRFLSKERDLRFETAASIAGVLGLQLVSVDDRRPKMSRRARLRA